MGLYIMLHIYTLLPQVVLVVKIPPTNARDRRNGNSVPSWEDPLKEVVATHSSSLIPV